MLFAKISWVFLFENWYFFHVFNRMDLVTDLAGKG